MPCNPPMMFCRTVGHAIFQTAGPMGPSTMERSNFLAGVVLTMIYAAAVALLRRTSVRIE